MSNIELCLFGYWCEILARLVCRYELKLVSLYPTTHAATLRILIILSSLLQAQALSSLNAIDTKSEQSKQDIL